MRSLLAKSEQFLRNGIQALRANLKELRLGQTWNNLAGETTKIEYGIREANRILNRVTGYDICEALRHSVRGADEHFQRVRDELQQSRRDFTAAIQSRSKCQKELNSLLQRKQSWQDDDLLRFTELYRQEMRLEQVESEAKLHNERLEKAVDEAHGLLMTAMRERYQEEQLWSDKIRRLSTYGTFSLMGLNLLLFLILQLVVEPRKRQRFIGSFGQMVSERLVGIERAVDKILATPIGPAPIPAERPSGQDRSWTEVGIGAAIGSLAMIVFVRLFSPSG